MKKQKEEFVQLKTEKLPKEKIAFVGWKKVNVIYKNKKGHIFYVGTAIVKLHIPTSANRIQADWDTEEFAMSNIYQKIRVSEAKVVDAKIVDLRRLCYKVRYTTPKGFSVSYIKKINKETLKKRCKFVSIYNRDFEYKKGKVLKEILDPRNIACASGIHCFTLRSSAESY